MNLKQSGKWLAAMALTVVVGGLALRAQNGSGEPARAVRLSYVDGQVQLSQGNQVLTAQAAANTPLMEGMRLVSADSGKAEIQFENGSLARLAPDSSLTIQRLRGSGATSTAELVLDSGLAYFELQGGNQSGSIRVSFAGTQATVSGASVFRIAMDTPPGQLAVFSGNLHLEARDASFSVDLHGGENIALNASDPTRYELAESVEPNSWDAWNSDRDQALTAATVSQTGVSSDYGESQNPAWSDLDAKGSWYNVSGQGYVWSPYDASNPGFDPYGNGYWMWTPRYGYLWVSGYSWGYLPFECGLWNWYDNFGWGWAPGMGACRPWWRSGFYGGVNIGFIPGGYRRIVRPALPYRPIGGEPVPVVPIKRRVVLANSALPQRDKSSPVAIGGNFVAPIQARPARQMHGDSVPWSGAGRAQPGNQGAQFVGGQNAGARPVNRPSYGSAPASGLRPGATAVPGLGGGGSAHGNSIPQNSGAPARNNNSGSAPPRGNNNGGGTPHFSNSGGGGGGGASHSSGGGAGGGGGGAHSSNGGGHH